MSELTSADDGVRRAMEFALRNLDGDLALADLAGLANMSTRNFTRRFREKTGTTPVRWLRRQRVARVRELLEKTDISIECIAAKTGFGSAVTLRQRFAESLHISPTAYRKAFRAQVRGEAASRPTGLGSVC